MKFESLEDKCLYYRSLSDYKLVPNSYVLCMVDGRGFSKCVKKRFKRPFDDDFVNAMNETAKHICKEVQGCKFGYVQSDEISFVLTDFDTPESDAFFGYRLCKMQSIIAGLATAKFNREIIGRLLSTPASSNDIMQMVADEPYYHFDCKCWTVPTYNDAIAWLLYRQIDCVRNSKQQAAQSYLSHKELLNKHTDEQVELLKTEKNIDWNEYADGLKYGRFVYKTTEHYESEKYGEYDRTVWTAHGGIDLTVPENRAFLTKHIPVRI